MKKFSVAMIVVFAGLISINALAASEQECQKLKDDYNLIYASEGYCFSDPEAKAQYGNDNCNTTKPKFSEKEQQKLDQIKARQKELSCK